MKAASEGPGASADSARARHDMRIRLAGLLRDSDEMLARAREGDWERVALMEARRRPLLEDCFSQTLGMEDSPPFVEAIATVKHQHEQLMALVVQARRQAMEQSRSLQHGRTVTSLYRQNGNG